MTPLIDLQQALAIYLETGRPETLRAALRGSCVERAVSLLADLSPSDAVHLAEHLPAAARRKALRQLPKHQLAQIRQEALALFHAESALYPQGAGLLPWISHVRALPVKKLHCWHLPACAGCISEALGGILVADDLGHPLGFIDLEELCRTAPSKTLPQFGPLPPPLPLNTPALAAWRLARRGLWSFFPVINARGTFQGVLTTNSMARCLLDHQQQPARQSDEPLARTLFAKVLRIWSRLWEKIRLQF